MRRKILVLYANKTNEVFDRKSALGSYINCLCHLLLTDLDVYLNGILIENEDALKGEPEHGQVKPTSMLKKVLPTSLKRVLKDLFALLLVRKLSKSLIHQKFDYVLEFYAFGSNIGYKYAIKHNVPLIVIYDAPITHQYFYFNKRESLFRKIIRAREEDTLKSAQHIVVYSNPVKQFVSEIIGRKNNILLHQNVDFTRLHFVSNKKQNGLVCIGFIGSFLPWHRVDRLIRVFNTIRREGLTVKLMLIGEGLEFENVQTIVQSSPFKSDIVMTGFLDGERLLDLKRSLDIGVMPGSNWYGAPNKIFEYGAARIAVVAPKTPTISDLFVHDEEVLLFEEDDEKDFYTQLKRLVVDRNLIATLSTNLQLKVFNRHNREETTEFYAKLIRTPISHESDSERC